MAMTEKTAIKFFIFRRGWLCALRSLGLKIFPEYEQEIKAEFDRETKRWRRSPKECHECGAVMERVPALSPGPSDVGAGDL